jgi:hypothetical protein
MSSLPAAPLSTKFALILIDNIRVMICEAIGGVWQTSADVDIQNGYLFVTEDNKVIFWYKNSWINLSSESITSQFQLPSLRLLKKYSTIDGVSRVRYGVQLNGNYNQDLIDWLNNGNVRICLVRYKNRSRSGMQTRLTRWGVWNDAGGAGASPFIGYESNFQFSNVNGAYGDRFSDLQYRIRPQAANFSSDGIMYPYFLNEELLVRRLFVFHTPVSTNTFKLRNPFMLNLPNNINIRSSLLTSPLNEADLTAANPYVSVRFGLALAIRISGGWLLGDILKTKLNFRVVRGDAFYGGVGNLKLSPVMNMRFRHYD